MIAIDQRSLTVVGTPGAGGSSTAYEVSRADPRLATGRIILRLADDRATGLR
jgi:hypothetical protein